MGLLSTVATAQQRVRDGAGFFSPQAVADASTKLDAIFTSRGASVIVETIDEAPQNVRALANDSRARDQAFSAFVRERAERLQADIYVLISKRPGLVRVRGDERAADAGFSPAQRDELDRAMRAAFDAKSFDAGLNAAVVKIDGAIRNRIAASRSPAGGSSADSGSTGSGATASGSSFRMGGCFMIGMLVVGGLIIFSVIRGISARRNVQYGGGYGPTSGPARYDPNTGQSLGGGAGYGPPAGGGGFGRGIFGGVLGGLLGGYMADRAFGNHHDSGMTGSDPNNNNAGNDAGNSSLFGGGGDTGGTFGDSGSNDLGGGGSDFGGGGDSGGDSGGDFGGGGDSGGSFGGD